ncbi:putative thiazole-containing bacteriocin maturation protein [Bacillus sp. DX1.1]|uniref:putative thiazole-containing bacteriocin maturation protein n=1 Tax=unclassified Bacillus (in: firmicutes) TaxID=185979 RepID=UPI00256FA6CC|nr:MULTISPECIES: putative thiazole-containing bacteriocin maturation protein [unclassified Bacillus (in: firmicutes)]MDM5155096.1 putative thiazole-containing bacteriocin maturation protein [Bacillus sp. DX1.1]WJE83953.1 putative thiazole-containing bacteriocin maturation protein [Bacillus sp. DX3.1]
MPNLNTSTRLKMKKDTFFLPDQKGNVYFRNNTSSFQMEGKSINQWVEKLLPMFNGEYTLGHLTDGLPDPYKRRVYEIAEILYQNEFAVDISQDRPHELPENILQKFASQIEFLDSFGHSGAYHFQSYRQCKVLAIGSGSFFLSLVSTLLESGLPQFHMMVTNTEATNKKRIHEFINHAQQTDAEVSVEEIFYQKENIVLLKKAIQPFDAIVYVSKKENIEELKILHAICKEEKKMFLPAICMQGIGLTGPLVHPDSDACWESAWRRIHKSVFPENLLEHTLSSTAESMLANVAVFELFKKVTGVTKPSDTNQFFLLNLETLEGNWHSFLPHPLVRGNINIEWLQDISAKTEQSSNKSESNPSIFNLHHLISKEAGIFHIWEEGDLKQLPLAQCRMQVVDPISDGPTSLLPSMIGMGLTHTEARYEAGLSGIEAYVSRMANLLFSQIPEREKISQHFIGIGVGTTMTESICRGLQKCLHGEFSKNQMNKKIPVSQIQLDSIEDERCLFYLQSLATMQETPIIGVGKTILGFPVMWVGTNNHWYGSVDLNITLALRRALQQALSDVQNQVDSSTSQAREISSVVLQEKEPLHVIIPSSASVTELEVLQSAEQLLIENRQQLVVLEIQLEDVWKENSTDIVGVLIRKEESS